MSEIIITAQDLCTAIRQIQNQINKLDSIVSDIASAHNNLLLDDVFSLESYSIGLLYDISSAKRKISGYKDKLNTYCNYANNAISGLFEADANSAGNQTGRSSRAGVSRNMLNWLVASAVPGSMPILTIAAIVNAIFNGAAKNTSCEIVQISDWKGKEIVDEKSKAVHSYYEQIMEDHNAWQKQQINEKYISLSETSNRGWHNLSEARITELNNNLEKYGITDKREITYLLAVCLHESDHGRSVVEYSDGSRYSGGSKYKGAGYIQLTGDFNYKAFAEAMGDRDILNKGTSYVAEKYAWESAVWYWKTQGPHGVYTNNVNQTDEITLLRRISNQVNSGSQFGTCNNWDDRLQCYYSVNSGMST